MHSGNIDNLMVRKAEVSPLCKKWKVAKEYIAMVWWPSR